MDGRIIAEAILLQKMTGASICFWTADYNMKLFAEAEDFYINFVSQECILNKEPWCGWGKYYPNTDEMASLYSNPQVNTLGAKTNEYCTIFEGSDLKDILRWDGNSYNKLNYRSFKSALGSKVEPRNTEQKMLFDLLQNRNIPIKLCLGRFGSGKSYLMLAHALNLIQKGEFDRIVFVKNNIQVKDTKDLGALPGEEIDKLMPWLKQIEDHVGGFTFDDMLQQGVIEPVHLGYIRGRDIKNSIIFCDEVENMTRQHIQLLIGRVSSRSELWLAGDLKQTDSINFEKNSGIQALINGLAGDPLFGMVKLLKSERSAVAALADKLD
jgi:PhoH-like ATPase